MIQFEFKIDKELWNISILDEEEYNLVIGVGSEAETDLNLKAIAFVKDRLTQATIEHEITHVYWNKCCLGSVDSFTEEQIEEIVAEFIPKYGRKIFRDAKKLKKLIDEKLSEV